MALISHIQSWTLRCICVFGIFQLFFLLTPWLSSNKSDEPSSLHFAFTKWSILNRKSSLYTAIHSTISSYDKNSYQKVWKHFSSEIKQNRSSSVPNVSRSMVHLENYKIEIIHFDFMDDHILNRKGKYGSNRFSIILLGSCTNTANVSSAFTKNTNIYHNIEDIIECIRAVSKNYPTSLLGWINPTLYGTDSTIISTETDTIEYNQHSDYLVNKYIQEALGLLVIKPQSTSISALRNNNNKHYSQCGGYTESQCAYIIETVQMLVQNILSTTDAHPQSADLIQYQQQSLANYIPNTILQVCYIYLFTRKYDALCHPPQALTHAVLVTGLGGAGTHYAAQRLSTEGWDLRHEEMASDGAVSWFYMANDHALDMAYPFGALPLSLSKHLTPRFGHIIHLIRAPTAQISSFTAHSNKTYDFVLHTMMVVLPELLGPTKAFVVIKQFREMSLYYTLLYKYARLEQHECFRGGSCHLRFAALTWLYWNRWVHRLADATFRVNEMDGLVAHFCQFAQEQPQGAVLREEPQRYCPVYNCPMTTKANNTILHSISSMTVSILNEVFDVCRLNDAMFRRSAVHKRHFQYSLEDVSRLDPQLAREIQDDAIKYGFATL